MRKSFKQPVLVSSHLQKKRTNSPNNLMGLLRGNQLDSPLKGFNTGTNTVGVLQLSNSSWLWFFPSKPQSFQLAWDAAHWFAEHFGNMFRWSERQLCADCVLRQDHNNGNSIWTRDFFFPVIYLVYKNVCPNLGNCPWKLNVIKTLKSFLLVILKVSNFLIFYPYKIMQM